MPESIVREKDDMRRTAGSADRAQEAGVDGFHPQRPPDQRQRHKRDRGDGRDQHERVIVERQRDSGGGGA